MTINGLVFREIPVFCGHCPAYIKGDEHNGWCPWFALNKHHWDKVPARCQKLFDKAFAMGDGDYVITRDLKVFGNKNSSALFQFIRDH